MGGKPIFVTVDTSPTGIGWVINQEDDDNNRYAIRFGAKVLRDRQRNYAQVKRELWGIVFTVKSDREYLIGTEVVIEMDCLPILGMISGCNTPDIAMLRWIIYIKSLNPKIRHIAGKRNIELDMLSRAKYEGGEVQDYEEEDVGSDFFTSSFVRVHATLMGQEYDDEFIKIGRYLSSLRRDEAWTTDDFRQIRKKEYKYFLREGHLWRHEKKKHGIPMRVFASWRNSNDS